jgi:hypothetical protein
LLAVNDGSGSHLLDHITLLKSGTFGSMPGNQIANKGQCEGSIQTDLTQQFRIHVAMIQATKPEQDRSPRPMALTLHQQTHVLLIQRISRQSPSKHFE